MLAANQLEFAIGVPNERSKDLRPAKKFLETLQAALEKTAIMQIHRGAVEVHQAGLKIFDDSEVANSHTVDYIKDSLEHRGLDLRSYDRVLRKRDLDDPKHPPLSQVCIRYNAAKSHNNKINFKFTLPESDLSISLELSSSEFELLVNPPLELSGITSLPLTSTPSSPFSKFLRLLTRFSGHYELKEENSLSSARFEQQTLQDPNCALSKSLLEVANEQQKGSDLHYIFTVASSKIALLSKTCTTSNLCSLIANLIADRCQWPQNKRDEKLLLQRAAKILPPHFKLNYIESIDSSQLEKGLKRHISYLERQIRQL